MDDRPESVRIAVQVHGLATARQIPPLIVAHPFVRESRQSGMPRIATDAERVRRLSPRPCRIPENTGESHRDIASLFGRKRPVRQKQHRTAPFEFGPRRSVQPGRDIRRFVHGLLRCRIDPDIPLVANLRPGYSCRYGQLRRFFQLRQIATDRTGRNAVAQR